MPDAKSSKGNPASKRMQNDNLKKRRARSWQRGRDRKEQNVRDQVSRKHFAAGPNREARRDALRARGLLPPIGVTREEWTARKMREVGER